MNSSIPTPDRDGESYTLALQVEYAARAAREAIAQQVVADQLGLRPGRQVRLTQGPAGRPWTVVRVEAVLDPNPQIIKFGLTVFSGGELLDLTPEQLIGIELLPLETLPPPAPTARPFDEVFLVHKPEGES